MIVNWMMMHYFYFDDQGNILYFTDRSKTGIIKHKRDLKRPRTMHKEIPTQYYIVM